MSNVKANISCGCGFNTLEKAEWKNGKRVNKRIKPFTKKLEAAQKHCDDTGHTMNILGIIVAEGRR